MPRVDLIHTMFSMVVVLVIITLKMWYVMKVNCGNQTKIYTMISETTKKNVQKLIFERAYEIEQKLSEDNFFRAKMAGVAEKDVTDVALKAAIMSIKKDLNE